MTPLGAAAPVGSNRARWALALAAFAGATCASYAAQRLGAWTLGEPGPGAALATLYTAYFWRLGLSVLHGAVVACALGLAVGEERARLWLLPTGRAVALLVAASALAMVWIP